ncbi:hypothetical protein [Pseudocitrobacter vendiensis]|uniref:Uncharacterized protein n=1 Tax=Pseudocitrobacter vendiensis TaxID=2488306 RepID=A0ABN8TGT5_9ENTR|nr:hypothetical protein [Pseudocitrobacter vendiensis]CAH6662059.1 hypothetical protein FBBNIHIM_23405 [Pseudocitrobacter vendiensis]
MSEGEYQCSIMKLMALGLTEYKAVRLIRFAQDEGLSLQEAYYESYCRIFRVDMILLSIYLFFFASTFISGDHDGIFMLFFFVLLFIGFEFFFRFHKGCWAHFKIYRSLKGL